MSAATLRGLALLQRVAARRIQQLERAAADAAQAQRERERQLDAAEGAVLAANDEHQSRLQRFASLGRHGGFQPADAALHLRRIDEQQAACRSAADAGADARAALDQAVQARLAAVRCQQAAQARAQRLDEHRERVRSAMDQAAQDVQDEETEDGHRPRLS